MLGGFLRKTYKRTRLWVYIRPNHELAGAASGHQAESNGTLPWSCHLGCHLLGTILQAVPGLCEVMPVPYKK